MLSAKPHKHLRVTFFLISENYFSSWEVQVVRIINMWWTHNFRNDLALHVQGLKVRNKAVIPRDLHGRVKDEVIESICGMYRVTRICTRKNFLQRLLCSLKSYVLAHASSLNWLQTWNCNINYWTHKKFLILQRDDFINSEFLVKKVQVPYSIY